jgi:arylsulfatase A-like enzyme
VKALLSDVYRCFEPDQELHRSYDEWPWIRGQEYDACCTPPTERRRVEDHRKPSFPAEWRRLIDTVCRNLDRCGGKQDSPMRETFDRASEWLRRNRGQGAPLLLGVETFDPHEPWTPPAEFDLYGDPSYRGRGFILLPGGDAASRFSNAEIHRIRSLYAGEVAYVDAMVGTVLDTLRDIGRHDGALVLLLSDRGHPLADHGRFPKGPDRMDCEPRKVAFGFKLPGRAVSGRRLSALAQFPDVLPTLLDAFGMGSCATAM